MIATLAAVLLTATATPSWDGQSFRQFEDASARISFVVPRSGFQLEGRHLLSVSPDAPSDLYTLRGPDGPELTIEVWVDPQKSGSWAFFRRHFASLRTEETSLTAVVLSSRHVPGVMLDQPRSASAAGRRTVVFAIEDRIFRVTCLDKDNPRARKVFDWLLESFESEPAGANVAVALAP